MGTLEAIRAMLSFGIDIQKILEATQLEDDLSGLRTSMSNARLVIDRGEWGRFKNKDLAVLLSQLKDTTYDAEDLLREFDDLVLWHKMEDADRSWAGQLCSSSLNHAKNLICRSKKRIKEAKKKLKKAVADLERALDLLGLTNIKTVQHMPETSSVIGVQVFGRDEERDAVIEKLGVMIGRDDKRDQVIELLGVPLTRGGKGKRSAQCTGATSASGPKRLKGEISRARSILAEARSIDNVSVLPIVGIGGVGKTTLAQYIYNDPRVEAHFGVRIWICVSDLFKKKNITKKIIESITKGKYKSSDNLDDLQVELMKQLKRRKFLLVLDDIWPIANIEWEAFYAPLRHGPEGSMILVTTRFPNVADLVTTRNCNPVQLEGLEGDIFWEFFRKCAFGQNCPEPYPDELQHIGRSIASRLCGSPLAAKTLGRLLNMDLTVQHWRNIQNSELWELPHQENEIIPALQLSYLYLPQELKRCFAFCSMFPKDYSFVRHEIVDIWVAQGFVAPKGSMSLEDMGIRYLDDLRSRFLFQTDLEHPDKSRYVMHDLIHDMARSVSADECFLLQDLSCWNQSRMPHAVRHMSVKVDGEALSKTRDVQNLNRLHSLRFETILKVEITWFNQLSNILYLSLKGCKLVKLPESIGELHSLRYLDISRSSVRELPEKFWCLYGLKVVDASYSSLKVISPDVTKLINLRRLELPVGCSPKLSAISGLGNLSCLRNLKHFRIGKDKGRKMGELKGINQLSGTLTISSICNVKSKEEAAEARLVDKQHLKALVLIWREDGASSTKSGENGVLEGLCPPPTIQRLKVLGFGGDSFSTCWFKPESLPTLRSLELSHCRRLCSLSIPSLPSLVELKLTELTDIEALTTFAGWFKPEILPSLKSLKLSNCHRLRSLSIPSLPSLEELSLTSVGIEALTIFDGSTGGDGTMQHASSSIGSSNGIACLEVTGSFKPEILPSLKSLKLSNCLRLRSLSIPSLPSLVELSLTSVGIEALRIFDGSTGGDRTMQHESSSISSSNIGIACLRGLTSIYLGYCESLRNLDQILTPEYLPSIQSIEIWSCSNLESIPVHTFRGFDHLQNLKINYSPRLVCELAMVLPPSLRRLYIFKCGELDKSFPACLQNLTSLISLTLSNCDNMESIIPIGTSLQLEYLHVQDCRELSSIGGSHALSSIQDGYISCCPKLQEVKQPFRTDLPSMKEKDGHHKFIQFW